MTNPTLIPLHDLTIDRKITEYPDGSGNFYRTGRFYLGGLTYDVHSLKHRLRWYYLPTDSDTLNPSAPWQIISDVKMFSKSLGARKMPWTTGRPPRFDNGQGMRIDFVVRVPSKDDSCSIALGLVGKNRNPDSPGKSEVAEESLVVAWLAPVGGVTTTNNFVPISIDRPWSYQEPKTKKHIVFTHSPGSLDQFRVFTSDSKSSKFPDLGASAGWSEIFSGISGYSFTPPTKKDHTNEIDLPTSLGRYVLIAQRDGTTTPESPTPHPEWSLIIRENR